MLAKEENDKTKTQCIILQVDSTHHDLEIVFRPEVMCKAVVEQIWYQVHKEHVVEILEQKIHLEEYSKSK